MVMVLDDYENGFKTNSWIMKYIWIENTTFRFKFRHLVNIILCHIILISWELYLLMEKVFDYLTLF